ALDALDDHGPFFGEEAFALAAAQLPRGLLGDEHAQAATLFHQSLVGQLLVGAGDGDGVELVLGRHLAHRGEGVARFEDSVEHHGDHALLQLTVDRSAVAPLDVAHSFSSGSAARARRRNKAWTATRAAGRPAVRPPPPARLR